jgi:thiamine biosynthesis lipoprotein
MLSRSHPPRERATPVFGSLASVFAQGCDTRDVAPAVSAAFDALRHVHRLMSFHEPTSELSRVNREACARDVEVSRHTLSVLARARRVSEVSGGAFDPTIAPLAVAAGCLPRPPGAPDPDPEASWRDVRLDGRAGTVSFARPLWLDLGGIAKGYAVDLAVTVLRRCGVTQGSVNAGGDLRVFGSLSEVVLVDRGRGPDPPDRAVRLRNASLAGSGGMADGLPQFAGHFDGRNRCAAPASFAVVMAPRCVYADALTKVVLARDVRAHAALRRFGARAALYAPDRGWTLIGGPA